MESKSFSSLSEIEMEDISASYISRIVADRINSLCRSSGKRQADICNQTGIEQSRISRLMHYDNYGPKKKPVPTAVEILKLAKFFGMSVNEFLQLDQKGTTDLSTKGICKNVWDLLSSGIADVDMVKIIRPGPHVPDDEADQIDWNDPEYWEENWTDVELETPCICFPNPAYHPKLSTVNAFVKALIKYTQLYRKGLIDEDDYKHLIEKRLLSIE